MRHPLSAADCIVGAELFVVRPNPRSHFCPHMVLHQSLDCQLMFQFEDDGHVPAELDPSWSWSEIGTAGGRRQGVIYQLANGDRSLLHFIIPTWLLVALSIALPTLLFVRWRFSLRTLLIAMTLIATLLGIIAISS